MSLHLQLIRGVHRRSGHFHRRSAPHHVVQVRGDARRAQRVSAATAPEPSRLLQVADERVDSVDGSCGPERRLPAPPAASGLRAANRTALLRFAAESATLVLDLIL